MSDDDMFKGISDICAWETSEIEKSELLREHEIKTAWIKHNDRLIAIKTRKKIKIRNLKGETK